MKEITLYNGNISIVDDDVHEKLSGFKYYENNKGYAYRNLYVDKKNKVCYLHREVTNAPRDLHVDHINGNPLDNRRENLRLVTPQQNQQNLRKTRMESTSKFKGVCWVKQNRGWLSTIRVNGKQKRLGLFETEESAAIAYNEAALENFGEYASLNDVQYDVDWKSKLIRNRREGVGKSKYIGVSYQAQTKKWQCHIMVNYKSIYLGSFDNELNAAKTYNEAAMKYRGEKAKLNPV